MTVSETCTLQVAREQLRLGSFLCLLMEGPCGALPHSTASVCLRERVTKFGMAHVSGFTLSNFHSRPKVALDVRERFSIFRKPVSGRWGAVAVTVICAPCGAALDPL